MVFCNLDEPIFSVPSKYVTILILVDGFLQYTDRKNKSDSIAGHNPYFSRWFSAIKQAVIDNNKTALVTILILVDGFLQSGKQPFNISSNIGHNPYFSRWFSAIK